MFRKMVDVEQDEEADDLYRADLREIQVALMDAVHDSEDYRVSVVVYPCNASRICKLLKSRGFRAVYDDKAPCSAVNIYP